MPLAVYDQSHDTQSRAFVDSLTNSGYFDLALNANSQAEIIKALDDGQVKIGVVIPSDLSQHIDRQTGTLLILLDGSDAYSLQSAYGAVNALAQKFSMDLPLQTLQENGLSAGQNALPIDTSVQTLYNPSREDLYFIIPGVAAMLLQMFAILGIAMTIVREREWGVAEQLLATPTRPLENIIGKIIPYFALSMFEMVVIHALGYFWFGVPFKGSLPLYLVLAALFVSSSLCVGLLLSTIATTQKQVQTIGALILLLSFLLTGLIFSRIPMPWWTQLIGTVLPVTHFIPIVRGIMVKGVGLSALWPNVVALVLFNLILIVLLPVLSRKRMD